MIFVIGLWTFLCALFLEPAAVALENLGTRGNVPKAVPNAMRSLEAVQLQFGIATETSPAGAAVIRPTRTGPGSAPTSWAKGRMGGGAT